MDRLQEFLGSEARAKLLAHFVVHPAMSLHVRALERHTGLGKRSLQVELERLTSMGLLSRDRQDRRLLYSRDAANPQWRAIESLVREFAPTLVLRDALRSLPAVRAAFVFGSVARGDARDDSDIDVLIYGNALSGRALGGVLLELALLMDRKLDVKRYDSASLRREARSRASFLRSALAGPKLWLIGSARDLPVRVPKAA